MGKDKLDETYIFEISIRIRFFFVSIGIRIPCFRVSVIIKPGHFLTRTLLTRSLLTRKI